VKHIHTALKFDYKMDKLAVFKVLNNEKEI